MAGKAVSFVGLFLVLGVATFAATKRDGHAAAWLGPWPADLYRAEIAARPTNWIPRRQALAAVLADEGNEQRQKEAVADFTERRNHFLLSFTANDLSDADLRWANLRYAFLPAVLMDRADLREAQLYSAQLEGALMKSADLSRAKLNATELSCARLPGATFDGAEMHSVRLHRAELTGATMRGALLVNADLSEADISHADLRNAVLTRANLTGASLWMANLMGADLSKARLERTVLIGAIGDGETDLPPGFDPLPTCYPNDLDPNDRTAMARLWGMSVAGFERQFVCPGGAPGNAAIQAGRNFEPERCWPLASGEERDQSQDQVATAP